MTILGLDKKQRGLGSGEFGQAAIWIERRQINRSSLTLLVPRAWIALWCQLVAKVGNNLFIGSISQVHDH